MYRAGKEGKRPLFHANIQALSTYREQGLCSSWVVGLPTLVASLAVERWALGGLGSVFVVKPNLPLGLRGKAGGGARVTAP